MIDNLIGPITGLLGKFIEDKDQKSALAHEIATMSQKVEAAHPSLFVSGWRPAVGWCCVFAMAGNFIIIPFSNFVLALLDQNVIIPLVPLDTMMPVLMGMLGLGAMRTYEKKNAVHRSK